MAPRGYAAFGTSIDVVAPHEPDAQWLDEFLSPAFERRAPGGAEFTVRLLAGPEARSALRTILPDVAGIPRATFALDREVVMLPGWRTTGGTVLDDPKFEAWYRLAGSDVDVVARDGATRVRGGLMRVVREIATARAGASADTVQLHAAGIELAGGAVLVAGAKASGKTTLLAYLCRALPGRLLTNDRALVRRTPDGFVVRPVPTIVSVRPGTLAFFPDVFWGVPAVARPAHLTLAEADVALAAHGPAGCDERLRLSPALLARCLDRALSPGSTLGAVLFPVQDADPDALHVDRLPPATAADRLRAARFGAHMPPCGPTVFEELTGATRPAGADDARVAEVAASVPCFTVRLGARRFANASAAEAIAAAVSAGRSS